MKHEDIDHDYSTNQPSSKFIFMSLDENYLVFLDVNMTEQYIDNGNIIG